MAEVVVWNLRSDRFTNKNEDARIRALKQLLEAWNQNEKIPDILLVQGMKGSVQYDIAFNTFLPGVDRLRSHQLMASNIYCSAQQTGCSLIDLADVKHLEPHKHKFSATGRIALCTVGDNLLVASWEGFSSSSKSASDRKLWFKELLAYVTHIAKGYNLSQILVGGEFNLSKLKKHAEESGFAYFGENLVGFHVPVDDGKRPPEVTIDCDDDTDIVALYKSPPVRIRGLQLDIPLTSPSSDAGAATPQVLDDDDDDDDAKTSERYYDYGKDDDDDESDEDTKVADLGRTIKQLDIGGGGKGSSLEEYSAAAGGGKSSSYYHHRRHSISKTSPKKYQQQQQKQKKKMLPALKEHLVLSDDDRHDDHDDSGYGKFDDDGDDDHLQQKRDILQQKRDNLEQKRVELEQYWRRRHEQFHNVSSDYELATPDPVPVKNRRHQQPQQAHRNEQSPGWQMLDAKAPIISVNLELLLMYLRKAEKKAGGIQKMVERYAKSVKCVQIDFPQQSDFWNKYFHALSHRDSTKTTWPLAVIVLLLCNMLEAENHYEFAKNLKEEYTAKGLDLELSTTLDDSDGD